jgi:hypothetical protein
MKPATTKGTPAPSATKPLPPEVAQALLHPEAQARLSMYLLGQGDVQTYELHLLLVPSAPVVGSEPKN